MKYVIFFLITLTLFSYNRSDDKRVQSTGFPENYWPGQRKAAISLTYDDGYVSNLNTAIPQLEAAGFRGTFYLMTSNQDVTGNKFRWKAAFENGHEIANHSHTHPCGLNLTLLTKQQLNDQEVGAAEQWLNTNIGLDNDRSYAFPCAELGDGNFKQYYLEVVQENCIASRTGGGGPNNDYERLSTSSHLIEGQAIGFPHGTNVAEMINYCESALNSGGWAVLIFHGIGDNHMPTDVCVHQQLINYLKFNENKYWVAPVRDVAKYIRQNPKQ